MLSWLKQCAISQAVFTSTHVVGVYVPSQSVFFTVTSVVVELQHSNMAMCISETVCLVMLSCWWQHHHNLLHKYRRQH